MRLLLQALLAGLVAGAAAGGLDAALAMARTDLDGGYVAGSVAALALVGVIGGPVASAAGRPVASEVTAWIRDGTNRLTTGVAVAAAVVALALALLAGGGLILGRDAHPSVIWLLLAGASLVATDLFLTLRKSLPTQRLGRAILVVPVALGAVAVFLRVRTATADLDLRWATVLGAYGLAVTVVFPALRRVPTPLLGAGLLLGLGVSFSGSATLLANPPMRLIAARYAPAAGAVSRLLARSTDWDRDGYSTLSGEPDCAPNDPAVHPFAVEVAGNGVDEDCHGGDLDPSLLLRFPSSVPEPPPARDDRPHIILILVDTLRPDRLGLYGYSRDTSPRIDEYFADAVVLERAYASSPVTDRSLPTMFVGQFPSMLFESIDYHQHELDERRVTLFERLADAGYYTATLSTTNIPWRNQVTQGLDYINLRSVHDKTAGPLTTRALEYLDSGEVPRGPLFLWLHYYDPHGPYEAPPEHRLWDDGGRSTARNRSDRYDAEVHYVDHEIGRLLDGLGERGYLDHALVILASDHGEEFLDHGGYYHAEELYDEQIRVPLAFRMPGLARRRVTEPVGLVDFMPTVLDLVHIPPPPDIAGRSQAAALRGEGMDRHPLFLEQYRHKTGVVEKIGVVDGDHKLIFDIRNQLWELYDLERDPAERDNLYLRHTERARVLRNTLLDYWSRAVASRP